MSILKGRGFRYLFGMLSDEIDALIAFAHRLLERLTLGRAKMSAIRPLTSEGALCLLSY